MMNEPFLMHATTPTYIQPEPILHKWNNLQNRQAVIQSRLVAAEEFILLHFRLIYVPSIDSLDIPPILTSFNLDSIEFWLFASMTCLALHGVLKPIPLIKIDLDYIFPAPLTSFLEKSADISYDYQISLSRCPDTLCAMWGTCHNDEARTSTKKTPNIAIFEHRIHSNRISK